MIGRGDKSGYSKSFLAGSRGKKGHKTPDKAQSSAHPLPSQVPDRAESEDKSWIRRCGCERPIFYLFVHLLKHLGLIHAIAQFPFVWEARDKAADSKSWLRTRMIKLNYRRRAGHLTRTKRAINATPKPSAGCHMTAINTMSIPEINGQSKLGHVLSVAHPLLWSPTLDREKKISERAGN